MRKAWQLAKAGAERFGGKAREYLAEAIREAWVMFRELPQKSHPLAVTLELAASLAKSLFGIKSEARNEHSAAAMPTVRSAVVSVAGKVSSAFKSLFRNITAPVTPAYAFAGNGTGHHQRE
ncbi:hypothetical protein BC374_17800 [Ensifer sp. LC13]|nr:hypothetical protein BC374_17800 [Ensifer sp. LC13]